MSAYDPYGTTRANWPGPILPGSAPVLPIPNKEEHFPYGEILYYSQTKDMENGEENMDLQIGVEAEARSNVRKEVSDMLRKELGEERQSSDESFLQWHVSPDYGELDDHVIYREADGAFYDEKGNGSKLSGWTNPLGWTDNSTDDD